MKYFARRFVYLFCFLALIVGIEDCFKLQSALVIIRGDEDGKLGYT